MSTPSASQAAASETWGSTLLWTGLYLLLAVAITWPLVLHLDDHLPKGNVPTSVPALAATWALWWVSDRLPMAFIGMWDAPIFFPAEGTFAFSETTLPLGVLAAPVFWLGLPPPLAYNLVVLGCLVGNGLSARLLGRELGLGVVAAGGAGALLIGSAEILRNFSVLPMVPLFGILLFVVAVLRYFRDPGARSGAWVGAAVVLSFLLSLQYGFFLVLLSPLLALALPRANPRRLAEGVAVGALVAVVALGPLLVPQKVYIDAQGFERTEERAKAGAASLTRNWLEPEGEGRLAPVLPRKGKWGQFPGLTVVGLILLGVAVHRRDRRVWSLLVLALASIALSTLPRWQLGGWEPYLTLREWIPGLAGIREVRRAGAVATALIPVLAAVGLDALGRRTHAAVPAALFVAVLLDRWPQPHRLQPAPDPAAFAPLNQALADHVPDDGAVFILPLQRDDTPTPEADRMVLQAYHGRRMVNGYSSYYPKDYLRLKRLVRKGPSPQAMTALREAGVTHIVGRPAWASYEGLEVVWEGGDDVLFVLR